MNFHNVAFEASYGRFDQLPKSELVEIAFAGRSNVGKSSMINKIFNRKQLARVSAMPGKTATINFFSAGKRRALRTCQAMATPRWQKAEKERWAQLIEGYFRRRPEHPVWCSSWWTCGTRLPTADDLQMIDFLIEHEFPFVVVLTKRDKLSKTAAGRAAGRTRRPGDPLCGSDHHDPVLVRKGRWGRGSQGNH